MTRLNNNMKASPPPKDITPKNIAFNWNRNKTNSTSNNNNSGNGYYFKKGVEGSKRGTSKETKEALKNFLNN